MTFLKKRPLFMVAILGLVAISSFAVSYSVMSSINAPAMSEMTVIGGSCCSVDTAGLSSCALETDVATVAAQETALDSCCAIETEVNTANTANTDKVSNTAVASVE